MADTLAGYSTLEKSVRSPIPGASKIGPVDPNEPISVSVILRRQAGAPDISSIVNPAMTSGRSGKRHLTRSEFSEQFGAAQSDLDRVAQFAQSQGLRVVESNAARRTVVLAGSAEQLSNAFKVSLNHYQTSKETYRGYDGAVSVPTSLADIVVGVHGFDDRQIAQPQFRAAAAGQATAPLTPPQVAKLYQFPDNNAGGQTIGILEFGGGYKPADIQNYFTNTVKLPIPAVSSVGIDGASNSPGASADIEVILDIDVAGSVAPGAKIVVYFAPNTTQGWIDAFTTAIHDDANKPSVLSISWAGGESGWGDVISDMSSVIQEAALVGVSIFVSSGDGGSGNPAEVLYPASDPGVTGCGGVTIENVNGTTFSEVTWGGSGGGISNAFGLPPWQSWVKVPTSVNPKGHIGRGVPDIAGNADPSSGYMLILNGSATGPWGGTSAVAPFYAGLVAVANAKVDGALGYLNPNLYAFNGTNTFLDVTAGSNGLYTAGPGWDACTGLGSLMGTAMVTAMDGVGLRSVVSCVLNVDGRLEAFAAGTDSALWHTWQENPHAGPWAAWASLGGTITSEPAVFVNSDGRIEAFARGADNALWHTWQEAPHAGPWAAWASLGGSITSDPAVCINSDGRLEVFARGTDKALWHIWQEAAHSGPWSAWASLGGAISSDPCVIDNSDGRLEVFARGMDDALWHIWQQAPHSAPWSTWSSLGGSITSDPVVAINADGRLEVFARGLDYAVWHTWQTAPHSGPWAAWSSLAGVITSDPAVVRNSDGRLEVFARGDDNALWHIWQEAASAGPWSAWSSLGGTITSDPAAIDNSDGRLEVFARGTDDALWHIWQTAAHTGPWSAWASLGGIVITEPARAFA